jgi:hypothetical protein
LQLRPIELGRQRAISPLNHVHHAPVFVRRGRGDILRHFQTSLRTDWSSYRPDQHTHARAANSPHSVAVHETRFSLLADSTVASERHVRGSRGCRRVGSGPVPKSWRRADGAADRGRPRLGQNGFLVDLDARFRHSEEASGGRRAPCPSHRRAPGDAATRARAERWAPITAACVAPPVA